MYWHQTTVCYRDLHMGWRETLQNTQSTAPQAVTTLATLQPSFWRAPQAPSPCLTHRLEGRCPCPPVHIFGGHLSTHSANKSKLWSSFHPMFPLPQRMARETWTTWKDFTGDALETVPFCVLQDFKAEGTLSQVKIRATGELPYFKMDTLPVNIPSVYPLPPLTINCRSDKQNPHYYKVLKLTGASVRSRVACSFTPLLLSILLRFIKILLLISILFATAEKALSSEDNWREAKRRIKQW